MALFDDTDDEEKPAEPMEPCSMCRRDVPSAKIAVLMGRSVCLDCAASFYDEDSYDEDEKR
jgi:hypothetical protein